MHWLTLLAMEIVADGHSENRAIIKLLISKFKRTTERETDPPTTFQPIIPEEFESASSTAAYRDPRFHPQPYREEEETTASTAEKIRCEKLNFGWTSRDS